MRRTLLAALAAALIASGAAVAAGADHGGQAGQPDQRLGDLVIERAWARQPLGANGAAYVTIRNEGDEPDRLVGIATGVADRAELHSHTMDDGVMRMRPVDALEIHPGEPAVMEPGGNHIMLVGMARKLSKGDSFALTLRFERAGDTEIAVRVMGPGASGPEGRRDGDRMDHDGQHGAGDGDGDGHGHAD